MISHGTSALMCNVILFALLIVFVVSIPSFQFEYLRVRHIASDAMHIDYISQIKDELWNIDHCSICGDRALK